MVMAGMPPLQLGVLRLNVETLETRASLAVEELPKLARQSLVITARDGFIFVAPKQSPTLNTNNWLMENPSPTSAMDAHSPVCHLTRRGFWKTNRETKSPWILPL